MHAFEAGAATASGTPATAPRGGRTWCCCVRLRMVVAELKSERGRLTQDQREALGLLAGCPGVDDISMAA